MAGPRGGSGDRGFRAAPDRPRHPALHSARTMDRRRAGLPAHHGRPTRGLAASRRVDLAARIPALRGRAVHPGGVGRRNRAHVAAARRGAPRPGPRRRRRGRAPGRRGHGGARARVRPGSRPGVDAAALRRDEPDPARGYRDPHGVERPKRRPSRLRVRGGVRRARRAHATGDADRRGVLSLVRARAAPPRACRRAVRGSAPRRDPPLPPWGCMPRRDTGASPSSPSSTS